MISASLCDYGDTCIHVKGTIIIPNTGTTVMSIKKEY